MTDRGRYWPGRRVLVLGCTGFLGGWAVRGLLARGAEVVGLVRQTNPDSEFFRDKLYQHVHVARGRADDISRLRTLAAVYETQLVVQCAADPDGSSGRFTTAAVAAAGVVPVVVPVHPGVTFHPRVVDGSAAKRSDVTLVRLPSLFGGGDRRWDRWPPRLLAAAARGEPLPPPPADQVGVLVVSVRDAVNGMLDSIEHPVPETPAAGYRQVTVAPQGTAADLDAAVRSMTVGPRLHASSGSEDGSIVPGHRPLAGAVAEAIQWYRTAVLPGGLPGLAPPSPKAAA